MKTSHTRMMAGAVSTVLNIGLIALVLRTGAEAPPVWQETAMHAELVQVRGGSAPSPAQSAQAPSSPVREPAPAKPVVETPSASVAPQPNLQVAAAAQPSSPAPASSAPAQQASAPPQRQGTREGLDIDAPNGTSLDYASRLRAWLEAHKTYPRRARMRREEGIVHVHFIVDRQGRLLDGDVVRSSGHASLDAEAMAMLDRSDPFPGAPHGVRGERIEVSTPVEFFLQR